MIELKLYQDKRATSETYKFWYPRVAYKETIDLNKLAKLLKSHNTHWSVGALVGLLKDMVNIVREQTLMGNTVKIDDLAIFKCSIEGNATEKLYDAEKDIVIKAAIGPRTTMKGDVAMPTGNAVKSVKLLAQATGEYSRAELNKDAILGWTDLAQKLIDDAKQPQP
jgi:hypothetical protein